MGLASRYKQLWGQKKALELVMLSCTLRVLLWAKVRV